LGLFGDRLLRLLLGADEEDLPAAGRKVAHETVGVLDARERLLQVDDVDAVALHEDEALHLRIPTARLMSEVHPGLQELLHGDDGHVCSPLFPPLPWVAASPAPSGVWRGSGPIRKACVIPGVLPDPRTIVPAGRMAPP